MCRWRPLFFISPGFYSRLVPREIENNAHAKFGEAGGGGRGGEGVANKVHYGKYGTGVQSKPI